MPFEFQETEIPGLYIVKPHYHEDQRGSNLKLFHKETFQKQGLKCDFSETMITTNMYKNVIRGFHYQKPPYTQSKLYYCLAGAWKNYSVDLRKGSPMYGKTICIQMDENDRKLLYIPDGIANAHLILKDHTKVLYQLTSKYMPEYDVGIRWDSLGIDFGIANPIISEKDKDLPMWETVQSPFIWKEG